MELLKAVFLSILAVFAPIKMIIITVGVLIFADMFLGIWAAHKRGEDITSAGMRRSVSKLTVYQVAILTGFLVETYLLGGLISITSLVAGVIGTVEVVSLLENAQEITGTDFRAIIKKLGSKNDDKP